MSDVSSKFMRRTARELRDYTYSCANDIEFSWRGIHGLIMEYSHHDFVLLIGEEEVENRFDDVDKMMNAPCLDGHSLAEVCDEIEFYS